ncbi:MAG TPA: HAD-IA family hydrolase [Rhodanobacteraceae bacterium]|nr:HAD-IA family hydrolase [Rhodanobacteraceae bacterium]
MSALPQPVRGVFFDLDGTLADSAPDMHAALAAFCRETGLATPAFAIVRETVSRGARAVLGCALDDAAAIDAALPRFLDLYVATGMAHTRAFPGVDDLLAGLEAHGIAWGVVSNKAADLVGRVLVKLGYAGRARAVIGGDTLPQRKPDPAPVLRACAIAAVDPAHGLFVGDDPRDIQAGRAAGLFTVAAAWGYLGGVDPWTWRPDAVAGGAGDLARWLVPA